MSIGDLTRKVLTVYAADASGHRSELLKLEVEVDNLKAKETDATKARKKGADDSVATLANLGLAYSALSKLATGAMDLMTDASERLRMESAAGAVEMDEMKEAAGGTRSELELLTFAAHAQHGALALNNDEMVVAQGAMREFVREGYNAKEVNDAITNTLDRGTTRGLKALGITLEDGSTKAETHSKVMAALTERYHALGDTSQTEAEKVASAHTSMTDAFDHLKESAGQLVTAIEPLIEGLAKIIGLAADIAKKAADEANKENADGHPLGFVMAATGAGGAYGKILDDAGKAGMFTLHNLQVGAAEFMGVAKAVHAEVDGNVKQFFGAVEKDYGGGDKDGPVKPKLIEMNLNTPSTALSTKDMNATLKAFADELGAVLKGTYLDPLENGLKDITKFTGANYEKENEPFDDGELEQIKAVLYGTYVEPIKAMIGDVKSVATTFKDRAPNILEQMFGTKDDFNIYAEAWTALSSTIQGAYDAIVAGGAGAEAAMKKVLASSIEAIGKRMFVEGIEDEALGIANADPSKMAAGAALLAGSVVAGIIAHELGYGSSPTPSKPSSGGGSSSGGSGSSSGSASSKPTPAKPTVLVIGNDGIFDTPKMKRTRIARAVDQALGTSGGDS